MLCNPGHARIIIVSAAIETSGGKHQYTTWLFFFCLPIAEVATKTEAHVTVQAVVPYCKRDKRYHLKLKTFLQVNVPLLQAYVNKYMREALAVPQYPTI